MKPFSLPGLFAICLAAFCHAPMAQGETWKWLNPVTSGGHLYGVDMDGSNVLAVGAFGSILRSQDTGQAWTLIEHGLTTKGLRDVAFVEGGKAVAVGDSGVLLRSEDAGTTWRIQDPGFPGSGWRTMAFHDGKLGLAAGSDFEMMRTVDGGVTWNKVALPAGKAHLRDVAFASAKVAVAVGDSGIIIRSGDGGGTWTLMNQDPEGIQLNTVAFKDSLNGMVFNEMGLKMCLRTTDGGLTWSEFEMEEISEFKSVRFFDSLKGVGVMWQGIKRTLDGGKTWATGFEGDYGTPIHAFAFVNENVGVAVGESGFLLRTVEGGATWAVVGKTLTSSFLTSIAFNKFKEGIITCQGGGLLHTLDEGRTWKATGPNSYPYLMFDVAFSNSQVAVAIGGEFNMLRTVNAGRTWTELKNNPGSDGSLGTATAIAFANPRIAVVAGSGSLLRSADSGNTWTKLPGPATENPRFADIASATPAIGVTVGGEGEIHRSVDSGKTWKPVAQNIVKDFINRVAFADASVGILICELGTVARTQDAGATWSVIPGVRIEGMSLASVRFASPTVGYIIGRAGTLFKTTDRGLNWTKIHDNLPAGEIRDFGITSAGDLYAVGFGGAILRSGKDDVGIAPPDVGEGSPGSLVPAIVNGRVHFNLARPERVQALLHDIAGRTRTLIDRTLPAGRQAFSLPASGFAKGRYVLELRAGAASHRMILDFSR
jgi:photosystem II stability/assembly factor-like uncharacterized protein